MVPFGDQGLLVVFAILCIVIQVRAATVTDFLPIILQALGERRSKFERACNYLADLHLLEKAHSATQPSCLASSIVLAVHLIFAAFYGPVEEDVISSCWSPLSMLTDYTLGQVFVF